MPKTIVTKELCEKAVKMNKDGKKMPEILRMTGLTYSQAWGAIEVAGLSKAELIPEAKRDGRKAAELRDQKQKSWGQIMVLFGWHPCDAFCGRMSDGSKVTEGKVRKAYSEATGIASEGLRIGKGGNFLLGEVGIVLYRGGERRKTGMEIESGMTRNQVRAEVAKGISERLTRLVKKGSISQEEADKRHAAAMVKADKILDNQAKTKANGVVKKATRKAPAKKVTTAVKKQRPSRKAATVTTGRQAARDAAMANAD